MLKIREWYGEGKQEDEVAACLDRHNVPINMEEPIIANEWNAQLDLRLNMIASMLISIDERLKAHEDFRTSVATDLNIIKSNVDLIKGELSERTLDLKVEIRKIEDELSKNYQQVEERLEQVLSRVDTYGKQRKDAWWNRLRRRKK